MLVSWQKAAWVLALCASVSTTIFVTLLQEKEKNPRHEMYSDKLFNNGSYPVTKFSLGPFSKACSSKSSTLAVGPPKPLLVVAPEGEGTFPVIVLQHGFCLNNGFYSQLMTHVASHGFIVVAPQMYKVTLSSDVTAEIKDAAEVINWLPDNFSSHFPRSLPARPDFAKLALAGHSRGGKVAFGLALGLGSVSVPFAAIVGIDPVDGQKEGQQTQPPILRFKQHSFGLQFPTLVVGSGLGSQKCGTFPACAPPGISHREFFFDSAGPAYHFVGCEYGHMDFLDDRLPGIKGAVAARICKRGNSREPMRRLTGGLLVAFFKSALLGDPRDFQRVIEDPTCLPASVESPEVYGKAFASEATAYTTAIM